MTYCFKKNVFDQKTQSNTIDKPDEDNRVPLTLKNVRQYMRKEDLTNRVLLDLSFGQFKVCFLLYFSNYNILSSKLSDSFLTNICELIFSYLQDYRDLNIEKYYHRRYIWHVKNDTVAKSILSDYFNINKNINMKIGIFKKKVTNQKETKLSQYLKLSYNYIGENPKKLNYKEIELSTKLDLFNAVMSFGYDQSYFDIVELNRKNINKKI